MIVLLSFFPEPLSIPKNVRALSLANENSILVEWDKLICSDVNKFHVYYCEATDGQNCTSKYICRPRLFVGQTAKFVDTYAKNTFTGRINSRILVKKKYNALYIC